MAVRTAQGEHGEQFGGAWIDEYLAPSQASWYPDAGTAEQKRALLDEAARPGNSMSEVARQYGVAPSLLFQWDRVMQRIEA